MKCEKCNGRGHRMAGDLHQDALGVSWTDVCEYCAGRGLVNRVPKPLLDFDDAGASDDEPAKRVTVGDIRAWHDQYDRLLSSWAECREILSKEREAYAKLDAAFERHLNPPLKPNPAMKKTAD